MSSGTDGRFNLVLGRINAKIEWKRKERESWPRVLVVYSGAAFKDRQTLLDSPCHVKLSAASVKLTKDQVLRARERLG